MDKAYRLAVNARLIALIRRHEKVNDRLRHVADIPADWEERALALQDEAVLAGLDAEARAEISAIRAALHRIDEGCYGVCASCGARIPPARLRALPFLITCVECSAG